mgnify:CR=1 FL=1
MNYPRPVRDVHQIELRGCLYKIDFTNGKSYIGVSKFGLEARMKGHRDAARRPNPKTALHRAMAKYGETAYSASALIIAKDFEYLKLMEIAAISAFGTKLPNGYNMTDGGDGQLGVLFSPETREKIASKRRGKDTMPPETRKKLAGLLKGRIFSDEWRRKLSLAGMGHPPRRIGPLTEQHKARIAASHKGIGHTQSTKDRLSKTVKAWWAARENRSMSEEQKKKISVARIAYWERRKAQHAVS